MYLQYANIVFIIENIKWQWSLKPASIGEEYWKQYLEFVNIKSIHELLAVQQVFSLIKLVIFSVFKNVLISGLRGFMLKSLNFSLYL